MGQSGEQALRRWLLLIYRVPQEPPARRTYVWRHLKQRGAIYLQQAAAILPDREDLRTALEELAARIGEFEGEVSLLETTSPSLGWEQELSTRFNQARDAEYAEVVENVERFEDEIRRERRKGRYTFAQLEDIEAEWEKLERWLKRVQARDFFTASGLHPATDALERSRAELERFTAEVFTHEDVQGDKAGEQPAEGTGSV
jgi:chromosome segregation ATPase